jgi:hypothetical protein
VLTAVTVRGPRFIKPAGAVMVLLVVGPLAGVLLAVLARNEGTIRTIVAVIAVSTLGPLTLRWPRLGILAAITVLAATGLLRRILIPVAGWSQTDPILLLAPAIALIVLAGCVWTKQSIAVGGALPALVVALMALTGLEVFNPEGAGLLAGLTGLLFMAAPLLWFFVGAWLARHDLLALLQGAVVVIACLAAAYGLWQTIAGFPAWDQEWIRVGGYASLQVGVVRAFSFFASSAEYALCLTAGIVVILARAMHGRFWSLPALPLLIWALVLESSRTMVVQGLVAIVVMAALLTGSVRRAAVIVVVGLIGIGLLDQLVAPHLVAVAETTSDPLIAHEAGGLGDPLNPDQSTVQIHLGQVTAGFLLAFKHPLGLGTAGTNLAGLKHNDFGVGVEVDIPNQFIALGFLGGALYLAIVVLTLVGAIRLSLRHRDVVTLATAGILIISFGQWLNGGYYAFAPLVWFLIGSIARSLWLDSRPVTTKALPEGAA